MKKIIGLLLAVTCFCGGKLETQADVTVLKRYPTGWQKQSLVSNEQRNIHNQNDRELLEIVFLEDDDPKHQTVYLDGCVKLTNIVIVANMSSTYFNVDETNNLQRLVSIPERRIKFFHSSNKPIEELDEIITPVKKYLGIWLVVEEKDGVTWDYMFVAWIGGDLQHSPRGGYQEPGTEFEIKWRDLEGVQSPLAYRSSRKSVRPYHIFFRLKPKE